MNKKRLIILAAALAMLFTGCGRKLKNTYDVSSFNTAELLKSEITGIRAQGFAAMLAVPHDDGELDTGGVNAEAFALFDMEGRNVLSQKNIFERVYPASTTKIMTCLLALELGSLDEFVTVSDEAKIDVSGSSMADLKPGDRIRLRDLLYGLMVPSGNDAAAAVAVHIGGSIENFAVMMNRRAAQLGATHTHFTNPHGLPEEDHYTTVYDLYLIFNEAVKHPEFCEISGASSYSCEFTNSRELIMDRSASWTSGNGFYNGKYTLPNGLRAFAGKTGRTNAAGFCLVLGEESEDGRRYISIIMKAPAYEELYGGMIGLTGKISL